MSSNRTLPANRYGHFSDDGTEYVITDPRPPRPWSNVIANERVGLCVSHTGSGFSWIDNSQLGTVTRWQQELADRPLGQVRLRPRRRRRRALVAVALARLGAPRPLRVPARHGLHGLRDAFRGIEARWTLFCDDAATVELWKIELSDTSGRARRLELTGFLEWCCGVAPAPRREFGRLFLETRPDAARRAVFAGNHMWDVASEKYGHWNTGFPVRQRVCRERGPGRHAGRQGGLPRPLRRRRGARGAGPAGLDAALRPPRGSDRRSAHDRRSAGRRLPRARVHARDGHERGRGGGARRSFSRDRRDGCLARARPRGMARAPLDAPDGDARRRARRHRQRLGAVPGDRRAPLGPLRLLPAERGLRIPGPAPGLAGLADDRSGALPQAAAAPRRAPVRRRLGLPLVASADGAGPRHEDDRRPPVALLRRGQLHPGDGRPVGARRHGAVPRREGAGARSPTTFCAPFAACSSARARAGSRSLARATGTTVCRRWGSGRRASPSGSASSSSGSSPTGPKSGGARAARTSRPSSATGAPASSRPSTRTAGTASGTCAARSTTAARSGLRATAWEGSS